MSTSASPNISSTHLTSEQLTVVAASFSSLVFFVVIVVLLSILYHKDPQCCKHRSYQEPRVAADDPPQYYSSRQTLVGSACLEHPQVADSHQQPGELFCVGLPSSYCLPTLEAPLPRLPSYESVRKKDRQRQIHMMIADRFGLNASIVTEPPPSYEESVRHSLTLPPNVFPSSANTILPPQTFYPNAGPVLHSDTVHRLDSLPSNTNLPGV